MNRAKFCRVVLFSALVGLGLSTRSANADDTVENPKYSVWAKFKPGSTNTVSADFEVQGNKIHVDVIRTLVSVTADQAVVETISKAVVMDHEHVQPAKNETLPAKIDKVELTTTGDKDVEAMGKTFKCKVWETKGAAPGTKSTGPGDTMNNMKATIYTSDEVPGGLVKLDGLGQNGKSMTFILTAMEAK